MNKLTPQQRASGKRAVILSTLYAQTTGKRHALPPTTEPLRLTAPRARGATTLPETPQPVKVAPVQQEEVESDPLAAIPGWMKLIGVVVIIVVVVLIFGTTTTTTNHQATSPKKAQPTATALAQAPSPLPVERVNQHSPAQYASYADYKTWHASTCSAASMTAIFNAYANYTGHRYRIADILSVESQIGEITPNDGLLHSNGIDKTAAQFGFTAQWLDTNTSYEDLIAIAKRRPVIVNFPPPAAGGHLDGGHFLIVTGGTSDHVTLVDSAAFKTLTRTEITGQGNGLTSMSRDDFLYYWTTRLAVILTPATNSAPTVPLTWNVLCLPNLAHVPVSGPYAIVGKPTITPQFINSVLSDPHYNSPARGSGQDLYNASVACGIDPVFSLAFFLHESTLGTRGEATKTLSLGNLRCISGYKCVDQQNGGYTQFTSWQEGFQVWARLIFNLYVVAWGRTTVDSIIPKYAPPDDGNDDSAYIGSLKHSIDTWHAGKTFVP